MAKRYKHLYEQIVTFENLWQAYRKARKGKRQKQGVSAFEFDLENELLSIQEALLKERYEFSGYHTFTIYEPAQRQISAAPFRDRVVHHAICNVIEPLLDKAMIYDSYACRIGKGMHRALDRAQWFLRRNSWVLKMDIKKYFFTIDHAILLHDLSQKFNDPRLLRLLKNLLNTYHSGDEYYFSFSGDLPLDRYRPRGLPIGNLTSQLFANYFLTPLDRFIKENLRVKPYLRYMDDLLIFANDKAELFSYKDEIESFLSRKRLKIHPKKTQVFPSKNSVRFLGFHLYNGYRKILRENLTRFTIKFKKRALDYTNQTIAFDNLLLSLNAWLGFANKDLHKAVINRLLSEIKIRHPDKTYVFTFYLP